jgi:peroxiredoxin
VLTTIDLRADKPVVLIYFAPDCDHCQTLMKSFFKRISEFKKAQVLMVTFKPLNDVANFEKNYQTHKYANLIVGSESQPLYLQQFYKLQNTPFVALYDKNKNLIFSYRKDASVDDLLRRLEQIN